MKKTYNVLSPVDHDQERFEPGSTIDLDDKDANPLLAVNVIEISAIQSATSVPTDPDERQAAIVAAIGALDTENADLWLRDGKPDTAAISEITGWSVTAAERNTAWATVKAA